MYDPNREVRVSADSLFPQPGGGSSPEVGRSGEASSLCATVFLIDIAEIRADGTGGLRTDLGLWEILQLSHRQTLPAGDLPQATVESPGVSSSRCPPLTDPAVPYAAEVLLLLKCSGAWEVFVDSWSTVTVPIEGCDTRRKGFPGGYKHIGRQLTCEHGLPGRAERAAEDEQCVCAHDTALFRRLHSKRKPTLNSHWTQQVSLTVEDGLLLNGTEICHPLGYEEWCVHQTAQRHPPSQPLSYEEWCVHSTKAIGARRSLGSAHNSHCDGWAWSCSWMNWSSTVNRAAKRGKIARSRWCHHTTLTYHDNAEKHDLPAGRGLYSQVCGDS